MDDRVGGRRGGRPRGGTSPTRASAGRLRRRPSPGSGASTSSTTTSASRASTRWSPRRRTGGSGVMRVNVEAMFLTSKHVIPAMIESGDGGAIVNISSIAALRPRGMTAYSTSKAAVIGLTRAMAIDHARDGIRVNCIAPGGGLHADGVLRRHVGRGPRAAPQVLAARHRGHRLGTSAARCSSSLRGGRATSPARRWWSTAAAPSPARRARPARRRRRCAATTGRCPPPPLVAWGTTPKRFKPGLRGNLPARAHDPRRTGRGGGHRALVSHRRPYRHRPVARGRLRRAHGRRLHATG